VDKVVFSPVSQVALRSHFIGEKGLRMQFSALGEKVADECQGKRERTLSDNDGMSLTQDDKDWMKDWLRQELRGTEARIVTEFRKWTSPNLRANTRSAVMRMIELEAATTRISDLEDRSKSH
jgi:hypothetical protein